MSNRVSDFGGLGDRVDRTRAAEERRAATPPPAPGRDATQGEGRHVFVSEGARGWVPGLLVAWEPRPDGWWGRVVLVRDGEAVELLVAARLLRPAHTSQEPPRQA